MKKLSTLFTLIIKVLGKRCADGELRGVKKWNQGEIIEIS